VVTTLNPHTLEDGRFTFENGCVGEVTLDATRCDACTCEVGCDTPGPIAPGETVEVVVTASDEPRETHPLEFQIGLVVYDAAFENDLSICAPPRDDGCAVAGAQAPARRAPWGGLVVVLGLWGWRRRRG
jgi:MYXO-CTERM domain-containing protein